MSDLGADMPANYVTDAEGRTWGRIGGVWYWMPARSTWRPLLPDGRSACRGTTQMLARDFGPLSNPRATYEPQ